MNHLSWDDIWANLDGELSDEKMLEHLGECPECQHRVEVAKRTHQAILNSFELPDTLPSDDEAVRRICAAVNKSTQTPTPSLLTSRRRRRLQRWVAAGLSVAAAGVLAVGVERQINQSTASFSEQHAMLHSVAVNSQQNDTRAAGNGKASVNANGKASSAVNSKAQLMSPVNGPMKSSAKNSAAGGTSAATTASTNSERISGTLTANVQGISTAAKTGVGTPLSGAHVFVLSQGTLVGQGVTGMSGNTHPMHLQVAVDDVLAGTFAWDAGSISRGNATVVVWKTGYRPMVYVDVPILKGQNELSALLKQGPGNKATSPIVMENGLHILEAGAYANWVQQLVKTAETPSTASPASASVAGHTSKLRVEVLDQAGHPVRGATVAIVNGTGVGAVDTTSARGWTTTLKTTTMGDTRTEEPGTATSVIPQVVNVVAFKSGYAPYVMTYVPTQSGNTTVLQVRVESMQWRQKKGYNNIDSPVGEPWATPPSDKQAKALLLWVQKQVTMP